MDKVKDENLADQNIIKLKELFPAAFTEGEMIDFDVLKTLLGENVDEKQEKYQFTWNGKSDTIRLAQKPSTGTLMPDKESSKSWDTTENLYIMGDNLEVLKLLQKTYHNKIKMIYIDPPYNTGGDFVYKDNFKDSIKNYIEQTNQVLRTNPETSGRYHTDWLNMMYSRLLLARNLLTDDGVIFISIGENEQTNISKICEEIFGESNFIANFIWKKKQGGGNDSNNVVVEHEYIISYSKNSEEVKFSLDKNYKLSDDLYPFSDEKGEYGLVTLDKASIQFSQSLVFEIMDQEGKKYFPRIVGGKQSCWRWGKEKVKNDFNQLVFKNNKVYTKYYRPEGVTPKSLLMDSIYGRTETGNDDIKKLFEINPFSYPKPVMLIKHFLSIASSKNDFILDFFSGSSTTAQAVMQLNAEDGGNRKFIMVQLPELTDEKSEAYKAGYKNICEIGEERIRRAGDQIVREFSEKLKSLGMLNENIVDPNRLAIGFKVFKLDSSNLTPFEGTREGIQASLDFETISKARSDKDVLYEIMLKYGVFDKSINEFKIEDKTVYSVGAGYLLVCLDKNITDQTVNEIAKLKPRTVIFDETGFKDDNAKDNAIYTLLKAGVEEIKSI